MSPRRNHLASSVLKISQEEKISNTELNAFDEKPCSSTTRSITTSSGKSKTAYARFLTKPKKNRLSYTRTNYAYLNFSKKMDVATKKIDSVVNKTPKKNFSKITIARSTHYYNRIRIQKLRSRLAKITEEMAQKHADEIKDITISCEAEYSTKLHVLNDKIKQLETVNDEQRLKIHELKDKYKKLKSDYDYEMDKSNQEILELAEQINDSEIATTFRVIQNALSMVFPEVQMRESFRKINPTIMKTLSALRLSVGLSLRNCIIVLIIVGNYCFSQK